MKNILLVFASIVVSIMVAEAIVRYLDGYVMFVTSLGEPPGSTNAKALTSTWQGLPPTMTAAVRDAGGGPLSGASWR